MNGGGESAARAVPSVGEVVAAWPSDLTRIGLVVCRSVDSTQRFARGCVDRLLAGAEEPPTFVVAALEQTAGRGRRGRSWASAPGLGVWATLVLSVETGHVPAIPMRTGVALAEECARLGAPVCLKWPNDLVSAGRKLGGLLVDVVAASGARGWVLIGFGIDCFHAANELPESTATSLALAGAGSLPRLAELLPRFVRAIVERVEAEDGWLERYRALSAHAPGDAIRCTLDGESVSGRFVGFDERGFLRLSTATGDRTLSSGDVFSW